LHLLCANWFADTADKADTGNSHGAYIGCCCVTSIRMRVSPEGLKADKVYLSLHGTFRLIFKKICKWPSIERQTKTKENRVNIYP
jgi:hypothetical protein